jgi:hypothetical protein
MGFNRRKLEDQRRETAEKEAANRRATDAQVFEDAERLIGAWNERQAKRMPMLFSPTIGAAVTARFWFLWVRCPACRSISSIDLRRLDRHPDAAVSSLIPALSCRSCRPNAPFATGLCGKRRAIAAVGQFDRLVSGNRPSGYGLQAIARHNCSSVKKDRRTVCCRTYYDSTIPNA